MRCGPRNRRGLATCQAAQLPVTLGSADRAAGEHESVRGVGQRLLPGQHRMPAGRPAGGGWERQWGTVAEKHMCNSRIVTSLTLTCCVTVYLGSPVGSASIKRWRKRWWSGPGAGGQKPGFVLPVPVLAQGPSYELEDSDRTIVLLKLEDALIILKLIGFSSVYVFTFCRLKGLDKMILLFFSKTSFINYCLRFTRVIRHLYSDH